ncbi:cytochrome c oxidase subunit 2 [Bacillus mesophilus]|uniref:Cytochrome c oxidase subunit 2 n=1 Tax=Bacillus mesophilus TaxID=1808955 RepID=A0A6M0Q274_9BACI|nr:cytochrome c oxidase subunit II [Bacillus mesophilus]MBM7659503.1 cytochrome c oxidase subunit 2 [Bacillus mesophilus]NEY70376.1 cytochrome c oxidase subunit II [Bacillus mesophilus]
MKQRHLKWRLFSLVTMMALFLAGCGKPFLTTLEPKGEGAEMQFSLMMISTIIMVFVVLIVTVIFIYVLFRFRAKQGDENKIPEQVEGNHKLEIMWTVIPILLLIILAVPTVAYTFKLADVSPMKAETRDEDALIVNVTAYLYWWEFEYPDHKVITSQDLVIPTGERVYFNLKGADVKHSFWVPTIGGKMDTNTDNVNQMWLHAYEEGIYYGKCAELCGPSHALMDFKVRAVAPEEFDQWIDKMANIEPTVDTDLAQAGEELFQSSCIGCHAVGNEGSRLAPNLSNFADRTRIAGVMDHSEKNLKLWLQDPETYKPGNLMTGTYGELTTEEIDALTEYLFGLSVEE